MSRQRHPPNNHIPSHRHLAPYGTLLLEGGYCEAGETGRWHVQRGTLIVHARGEAHADWFGHLPTRLIDFSIPDEIPPGVYRPSDVDELACSIGSSEDRLRSALAGLQIVLGESDWPDLLAADIRKNTRLSLGEWAEEYGVRRGTVSRGFFRAYGVSPAAYRLGVRVKAVIEGLHAGRARLAELAAEHGFSDQPHMNRAIRAATGLTPAQLRQVKSVQDGATTAV